MDPQFLPIVDGLLLFALFVGAPLVSAAIGYAAWKGKSHTFDRERFGLLSVTIGTPGAFLMAYALRMHSDVRTPWYFLQLACFTFAVALLGIAGGCVLGIFTHRHRQKPPE